MLQINKDQLKQFYKKCQKDKLIGIDTEFYRVDTYYPKLCLIQLANKNDSIFLDPITQDLDYTLLKKLLFNTKIKNRFIVNYVSFLTTELEKLKLNTSERKILLSSVKLGQTRLIDNIEFN